MDPELTRCVQVALDNYGHWLEPHVIVDHEENNSAIDNRASILIDSTGKLRQQYGGDRVRLYLVRPDGYIAYRSERIDRLKDYLAHVHFG